MDIDSFIHNRTPKTGTLVGDFNGLLEKKGYAFFVN